MTHAWLHLGIFTAKIFIILFVILIILISFFVLLAKGKQRTKGRLVIKNLNKKFAETSDILLAEIYNKKQYKQYLKDKKIKAKTKSDDTRKNIYVLNFCGDIKATAVNALSEEITAVLGIATPNDEVVVKIESAGGVVHGYGLAAAQLMRIRNRHIPLTVTIDKVAASGGYMMACIANKILSAPFAIIGSIGVIVQLPNFNRLLKDKNIDFEQQTAGEFKRTLTIFGENTDEGREKLQHEIENIHQLFKNLITEHRQQLDIDKVATGEHWLGQQAIGLKLVDDIATSDDYLMECSQFGNVYEITYETKKPFMQRLTSSAASLTEKLFHPYHQLI